MTALEQRRQAACRAYSDALDPVGPVTDGIDLLAAALDDAIEAATRVRITPEIIETARDRWPSVTVDGMRVTLHAAFTAAGFEVVE